MHVAWARARAGGRAGKSFEHGGKTCRKLRAEMISFCGVTGGGALIVCDAHGLRAIGLVRQEDVHALDLRREDVCEQQQAA